MTAGVCLPVCLVDGQTGFELIGTTFSARASNPENACLTVDVLESRGKFQLPEIKEQEL